MRDPLNLKKTPYNAYPPAKRKDKDEFVRPVKPGPPNQATVQALEELESINTWDEFVEIVAEQRRKRGW